MGRLTVNVTQEDIDAGRRCAPCFCPIALAASRATGEPITVTARSLWIYDERILSLPTNATDFMFRFDRGGYAVPFSFDIDWPGPIPVTGA